MLGLHTWAGQNRIARSVLENERTACRTGQKTGKSTTAAALAIWWVLTRPRGICLITAPAGHQLSNILWPEIQRLYASARMPLGGVLSKTWEHGWRLPGDRRIFGVSTDDPRKLQGVSGANQLIIVDEASGFEEKLFGSLLGNMAGGGKLLAISNPNEAGGTFYEAFTSKQEFWSTIHLSSEETPNYVERREVIPGLAGYDYIEARRREWGEDSPLFQVRVKGNFPSQSSDSVVGIGLVEAAGKRYDETPEGDTLELGVDVARFGDDESVIQPRRGRKALPVQAVNGFDNVAVAGLVRQTINDLRRKGERVRIKVDGSGNGSGVVDVLRAWNNEGRLGEFVEIVDVNVSNVADAEDEFERLRDQLWWGIRTWLAEGGALPPDSKRDGELTAVKYGFDSRGRIKVESKKDLKKRLGRSPDRADALALAVYEGARIAVHTPSHAPRLSRWSDFGGRGF